MSLVGSWPPKLAHYLSSCIGLHPKWMRAIDFLAFLMIEGGKMPTGSIIAHLDASRSDYFPETDISLLLAAWTSRA